MHVHGPREVELRLQRVENGGRLERWRSRLAGQFFNNRYRHNTGKDRVWAPHFDFFQSVDSYYERDGGVLFGI